jgi:hypothetical protein
VEADHMTTAVQTEIIERLTRMPASRQRLALDAIRALSSDSPRGARGSDLLDLAGTCSPEDAAQMTATIDEAFERIEPDAW